MLPDFRSSRTKSLAAFGLEILPWIVLTGGLSYYSPSLAQRLLPYPRLLLPLLVLFVGSVAVFGRRRWGSSGPDVFPALDASPVRDLSSVPNSLDRNPEISPHSFSSELSSEFPSEGWTFGFEPLITATRSAGRDALTGLATRTSLLQQLSQRLESNSAEEKRPALLSITLHEYGDVADSFGHDAGQQLLAAGASRIQNETPPAATTARIAENTFAVLLPKTAPDRAREIGCSLLEVLSTPFQIAGHQFPIESSLGIAVRFADDSPFHSAEEMLQASHSAMHKARRQNGPNLYVSPSGDRASPRRLHRRERLRRAIRQDELTLLYQPIVHLVTGEMVGAEALVRWNHPERGLLSPSAFIPLAEETGLIGELDRWVFGQALRQASEWTSPPDSPLEWVSVNLSPQSLQTGIESWCKHKLRDASLPDGALHLEITEGWALRDDRSFRSLRDDGVRLVIDDFGTGYSSLQYLRSLDADILKIDREFIEHLGQDPKTTAIVQFLLNLSLRLDVGVIAEGVETADQETILRELGCAMAQGYYVSKPILAETLVELAGPGSGPPSVPSREPRERTQKFSSAPAQS